MSKLANWLGYVAIAALLAGLTITIEQASQTPVGKQQTQSQAADPTPTPDLAPCTDSEPLCNGDLAVRVFFNYRCDTFYQQGVDRLLPNVEVQIKQPKNSQGDTFTYSKTTGDQGPGSVGWVRFRPINLYRADDTVTVTVLTKEANDKKCDNQLTDQDGQRMQVTLDKDDFGVFDFRLVDFRTREPLGGQTQTPTPTPISTLTPTPTATPVPSATATPTPMATPTPPNGCENCYGGTQIRYPGQWDDDGDGTISSCNEACKAYWGPSCNGNQYCGNPGSSDASACCACQASDGTSCDQLTPLPSATPTSGQATPAPASPTPNPADQPAVCNNPGVCGPHPAINLSIDTPQYENGNVTFRWNRDPAKAAKYTLRWSPVELWENVASVECCSQDYCTGEQYCGNRESCRGKDTIGFDINCSGNRCSAVRRGIEYCKTYRAQVVAEVNTPVCSAQPQTASNTVDFIVPGADCQNVGQPGDGGDQTPTPTPQPTGTPPPAQKCENDLGVKKCSVENLSQTKYFGEKGKEASMVCRKENPQAIETSVNGSCLYGASADYSIGLFQINLLAHDAPGLDCTGAFNWTSGSTSCSIKEGSNADGVAYSQIVEECTEYYQNADNNIKKAVELYNEEGDWNDWNRAACLCELPGCNVSQLESNVTGDDYIDAADVAVVMSAYGTSQGDVEYNASADFCGPSGDGADGVINAYEISCLIRDWSPRR